ncbi:hypothetical protein LOAG_08476 [Loa loa]|uniref:Uncharacterized protein n=1 Tax=Loa loa TaxID=7209 RepID=A0A1S0TUE1_LOALO|nr:hypothetical protein LOAG_08476 [Loa loa]EFO20013.1 hypothetical protein LOAG_08476 [Loa loa]
MYGIAGIRTTTDSVRKFFKNNPNTKDALDFINVRGICGGEDGNLTCSKSILSAPLLHSYVITNTVSSDKAGPSRGEECYLWMYVRTDTLCDRKSGAIRFEKTMCGEMDKCNHDELHFMI